MPSSAAALVEDFDALPIDETLKKPRVGVVGEILVKYMPLANNHVVDLLEREGAEAVVPDLLDFFAATIYEQDFKHTHFGKGWTACGDCQVRHSGTSAHAPPRDRSAEGQQAL